MHISEKGLALIKSFEGCRLKAYQCAAGAWSIGWGTTSADREITGTDITPGMQITQVQADGWLAQSIAAKYEPKVNKYDSAYHWTQSEFDALVSYAYNIGSIKGLVADGRRTRKEIIADWPTHDRAGGRHIAGLKRRRLSELELFLQGKKEACKMNPHEKGKKALCGGYSEYTPTGKSYFVKAKRWHIHCPTPGDVVYFYSEKMGRVCHVGIVIESQKHLDGFFSFKTVEGNTSSGNGFNRNGGCVAIKEYKHVKCGGRINGFGSPNYGPDTCTADDVLKVAQAEVGYEEKASNAQLDDKHANAGKNNFTKYGKWYGDNGTYWCQQFVSWVFYKACAAASSKTKKGWVKRNNGIWSYCKDNEALARNEWLYVNGRWYAFDWEGKMIRGWFRSGDDWYYLGEDGGMLAAQWVSDKEKQYYLTQTGVMATNAFIRSDKPYRADLYIYYYVDSAGVWQPEKDTDTLPAGVEIAK